MPFYEEPVNFQPHNLNSTVVTISGPSIDTFTLTGIHTIVADRTDARFTSQMSNSGMTCPVHNPSRMGTITIGLFEPSPQTKQLSDIANGDEYVTISIKDSNAPDMNASCGFAYLSKHVPISRSNEIATPEWVFECPYLNVKSGGYAVIQVA